MIMIVLSIIVLAQIIAANQHIPLDYDRDTDTADWMSQSHNDDYQETSSEAKRSPFRCPDRCTCSMIGKSEISVYCFKGNYSHVPPRLPIEVVQLRMNGNVITKLKFREFFNLSRLTQLHLPGNAIECIDAYAFEGLILLTSLYLDRNPITSLPDFVFSPLLSLKYLGLENCFQTPINAKAFINLTHLEELDLGKNRFVSFPTLVYKNESVVPKLHTLNLYRNNIKSICSTEINDDPIFTTSSYPRLAVLRLSTNLISNLSAHCFRSMPYLKVIYLVDNRIVNIDPTAFVGVNNLHRLELQTNRLETIENYTFSTLPNLTHLDLSNNRLTVINVNAFVGLRRLRLLRLDGLRLTTIPSFLVSNESVIPNLSYLSLIRCGIAIMDCESLKSLPKLETLNMSQNSLRRTCRASINRSGLDFQIGELAQNRYQYKNRSWENSTKLYPKDFTTCNKKKQSTSTIEIRDLNLNNNSMIRLESHSFSKFTALRTLALRRNKLSYISPNTFEALSNLENLDMSDNDLVQLEDNVFYGLSSLKILLLNNNKMSVINSMFFKALRNLIRLELKKNNIYHLSDACFSPLTSLLVLDLSIGALETINVKAFLNVTSLIYLNIEKNSIKDVPEFIHQDACVLPNLTSLKLTRNNLYKARLSGVNSLTNLQTLILDKNSIRILKPRVFESMKHLTTISIRECQIAFVEREAFKSESLTNVSLVNSLIGVIDNNAFDGTPLLTELRMALRIEGNKLFSTQTWRRLSFKNFIHLKTLDLSNTETEISKETFENTTGIQHLNLNDLRLRHLDRHTFENFVSLKSLHLRNTELNTINYTSLPVHVWKRLNNVDLSDNPYSCDCSIVWFRRWLRNIRNDVANEVHVQHIAEDREYTCYKGESIIKLDRPSDQDCFEASPDWFLLTVMLITISAQVISACVAVLYRFRWNIRYWQFIITTKHHEYRELLNPNEFAYDAFVIYSHHDSQWVVHELCARLEIDDNFRLCIHQRDWPVGRDITDNVDESLQVCRKCILVVSNAFSLSQWCHYEMTAAQTRLMESDRDNIILLMMEEVTEMNVTPRLRLQTQRKSYIEWTDNVIGQQLFWGQLRRELLGADTSTVNAPLPRDMFCGALNENNN